MKKKVEPLVDEGFRVSLVAKATFDGAFEIPHIKRPDGFVIPSGMVPFSLRNHSLDCKDFVCFYEHDKNF